MRHSSRNTAQRLMCGAAAIAMLSFAGAAQAEQRAFTIEPQSLSTALAEFGAQSGHAVMAPMGLLGAKTTNGFSQSAEPEIALAQLLDGTGLTYRKTGDTFAIVSASDPQSGSAAGDGADAGTVQALIVTAQKREENIQDVPIAMSAFSQEDLTKSQVSGGPDLMTQVPNFTFTKTNFSGYSIQIRGIGTQAISATTDAAVAVAFNNTPFIRNRFFEQEFYDLQRVEVLRGPQGTLYGRNATAGVVNIISAKPKFAYEAKAVADVANYNSTRLEGMLNIPLVEDKAALRLAGAWTKRDGYATNSITGNPIDGRDLWSTRVSLRVEPTDAISVNVIWEHFQEDDDRLRSGKQLCKTDNVSEVGGIKAIPSFDVNGQPILIPVDNNTELLTRGAGDMFAAVSFSQGCSPESLYSPQSFQTPNGLSLPYYHPLSYIFLPAALRDPYASRTQSTDLRAIESTVDPIYRAKSDIGELQFTADLPHGLSLTSETAYGVDELFSLEDFNRFNTAPGAWQQESIRPGVITHGPDGGIFCDPQIGCSDRLVAVDLSTAKSTQFSQEFRLASNYTGDFNFSLGGNFLRYDTEDKYYVFVNSLSLISIISPYTPFDQVLAGGGLMPAYVPNVSDNHECMLNGHQLGDPSQVYPILKCTYLDPNPIDNLNDQGHNYFLSKNPYKLISYAVFGEAYYNLTDKLKVTAGLRWTVDKKEAPRIPSWLLAANTAGYPVASVTHQRWSKPTGRLTIDWKPDLGFTDETLLYASFAHGYKAGGANPPGYTYVFYSYYDVTNAGAQASATRPKTFDPEYINAYEVGAKNTLDDGRVTLNLSAFYYDYTGYQISEIVERSAFNFNFDAKVWGAEVEAQWRPLENLTLGFKGGYEKTRINDGMRAVDLMDRTAGHNDWVVVRPFPTFASNCILPKSVFAGVNPDTGDVLPIDLGGVTGGNPGPCEVAYILNHDPVTDAPYVDLTQPHGDVAQGALGMLAFMPDYPGWNPATAPNHGEGFYKELGGHELPNAPHFTATVTGDYTLPLAHEWRATLHGDFYYQSEAWTRVFNLAGYDRLKAYTNLNLAAIFTNEDAGWRVMAYVKNVFNRTSITGAFLNSDDTDLTTNVFLTEPRLYGLRVTKEWTGAPLFGLFGASDGSHGPYPWTVELGGQTQRMEAPLQPMRPGFASTFAPVIDDIGAAGAGDLDWGAGGEIKLAYHPVSSPWSLSAGFRYGRANASHEARLEQHADRVCAVGGPAAPATCAFLLAVHNARYVVTPNWSEDSAHRLETHTFVDFAVGRDVSLGQLDQSTVSLGLRYGQLRSDVTSYTQGVPDWVVPPGFWNLKYHVTHTRDDATLDARHQFKGAGPVLSWEAANRLAGGDETGRLDLDWSLSGGVLFGKQTANIAGTEHMRSYDLFAPAYVMGSTPVSVQTTPVHIGREAQVAVPTLGGALGLSYRADRLKVGAGYRWERYFNAIDGGYADRKSEDRTIDGPYFKIAVGFGG